MNSQDPTMTIILVEIVLFELVVIITAMVFFIIKKRNKSRVLKSISEKVSESKSDREAFIKSSFKNISSLSEEELSVLSREIVKEEFDFYQYIIDALYLNDAHSIEDLKESIEKMVLPYTKLSSSEGGEAAPEAQDEDESIIHNVDDAIDDLLDDNNIELDSDPEFDLSEQSEIAEIPDDLLDVEDKT